MIAARLSWVKTSCPARKSVTYDNGLVVVNQPVIGAHCATQALVLKIEADGRLRAANDAVLGFMRGHRIASLWGRGLFASADMMSLEATRYLWSARLDPRRRTYAVGTYAHVLDQWGILYDQPIVLNRRQAGAAIEGALRQGQVGQLERVAVDTHGFSHFAMTLVSGAAAPHSPGSADHAALKRWTMCCGSGSRLLTVRALVRMVVGAHGVAGCRPSPTATGAGCGQGGGIVGILV